MLAALHCLDALGPASARATTVRQTGARWLLGNASLKVTVEPAMGTLDVYDRESHATWHQAADGPAGFQEVTKAATDGVRFRTTFRDDRAGALEAWVEVRLLESTRNMPWVGLFDSRTRRVYSMVVDTPYDATFQCLKFGGLRAPQVHWEPEKGVIGYTRTLTYHITVRAVRPLPLGMGDIRLRVFPKTRHLCLSGIMLLIVSDPF